MNEFKDELIKNVSLNYNSIDFSILPICVKEAYERQGFYDLIFLLKISDFLNYYNEFKNTINQKTSMNVRITDSNDMLAYMKLNSKIKIKKTDDIIISQEMIRRIYSGKMGDMISMFDKYVEKTDMIFNIFLDMKQSVFEEYLEKINTINKFLKKIRSLPQETFSIFVSWSTIKNTSIEKLFNKLSFADRFLVADIIMNDGNHLIDPENYHLVLVIKLLMSSRLELSSEIVKKHIMLRFICYKENDNLVVDAIMQNIIELSDVCQEHYKNRIEIAASIISSIHGDITKGEIKKNLKLKCQQKIESMKEMILTLSQNIR